ncbi:hypothetical protein HGRIS_000008 [Hohenbuehelia grisea]|uniref:Uncharacterized protein n=1 Tax=Hohenbuehelia grisea TaxID=104357 RepID=A0ABR3JRX0_9AGAR
MERLPRMLYHTFSSAQHLCVVASDSFLLNKYQQGYIVLYPTSALASVWHGQSMRHDLSPLALCAAQGVPSSRATALHSPPKPAGLPYIPIYLHFLFRTTLRNGELQTMLINVM